MEPGHQLVSPVTLKSVRDAKREASLCDEVGHGWEPKEKRRETKLKDDPFITRK